MKLKYAIGMVLIGLFNKMTGHLLRYDYNRIETVDGGKAVPIEIYLETS